MSSAEEANELFIEFHASPLGEHCGVEKTHSAIIVRYYWPGMEADIRKWVSLYPQNDEYTFRLKSRVMLFSAKIQSRYVDVILN